ncbi:hypothetical protein GQR36_08875 [Enterococcus termitis]
MIRAIDSLVVVELPIFAASSVLYKKPPKVRFLGLTFGGGTEFTL